jgi:hypothetical protein
VENVDKTPVRPKKKRNKALYFISKKERFRLSVGKNAKKERKRNMLNTIEQTMKSLNSNTITTMTMDDNEGAKNKEHIDDHISQ